jgi:dTDP-4-amino-4,6-dideoxygalactose transaminase
MALTVPLVDLSSIHASLRTELDAAYGRVMDSGRFIGGEEVSAFETELLAVGGAAHAIGVSSGTDALLAALMALGIGRGDEVVTTPFSFFATAAVVSRLGARPVFAEIDPETFNIDAAAAESAVRAKTRAVIVVDLYGQPAVHPKVDVPIIEDAAQSLGARPVSGALYATSFFPTKNLGGFGDGGAVLTNDEALADQVRVLRNQGARPKYFHSAIGGNFRLDALQAALLRVKLPHLAAWTQARRANAARYRQLFGAGNVPAEVRLPTDSPGHVYNQFVIRAPRRDELRASLSESGIATEIYYPRPFHLQEIYAELGYDEGAFPDAEAAAREVLALPIYPGLSEAQQSHVVDSIAGFYAG